MFKNRTLLVVGAGASKEAGLPVGSELAQQISRLLTYRFSLGGLEAGNPDFLRWLQRYLRENDAINDHLKASARIAAGVSLVGSIDNYIDTHQDDSLVATCGKAAIAYSIMEAERCSALHSVRNSSGREALSFDLLEKTWFTLFGRLLVDQVRASDVEAVFTNLTIICFNYDRCIEEFLAHWLCSVYAMDRERARALVEVLRILRPYGQIGALRSPVQPAGFAFGEGTDRIDIGSLKSSIRTYTEQVEDGDLVAQMRTAVAEAETIVFLGFAFHQQNMQLIGPGETSKATRVFASAYGFSDSDADDIGRSLQIFLNGSSPKRGMRSHAQIHVRNDLTCGGIFTEFKRSLSLS